jgi:hypothetical protein
MSAADSAALGTVVAVVPVPPLVPDVPVPDGEELQAASATAAVPAKRSALRRVRDGLRRSSAVAKVIGAV